MKRSHESDSRCSAVRFRTALEFYIHHKRISFEEEFKRLLAAYGIQEE
jgi:hypothetical protein